MNKLPSSDEPIDPRLAAARIEARRLIDGKPWRDRLDWAAGRVVYDPGSQGSLIDLMVVICFLIGFSALIFLLMEFGAGVLATAVVFLVAASMLIQRRIKGNRLGRSECLLVSIPARIGGVFEAEIRVRVSATQALVSLINVDIGYRKAIEVWRAEQRISRDDIRIGTDGTWTIPVRIPIPPEIRAKTLGVLWRLQVHAQSAGPDLKAHFEVPIFDLADLGDEDEQGERKRAELPAFELAGGLSGTAMPDKLVDPHLAEARVEARRLIDWKPWRDRPDWVAGRILDEESECLLRSNPARIGGEFEGELRLRLRAMADTQVIVSLANALAEGGGGTWRTEQRIGRDEIRVAGDGRWTIPVRISIPAEVRERLSVRGEGSSAWYLEVQANTAGPDFTARFQVPVFDLADLPYKEEKREREAAALATSLGRNTDIGVGLLVGIIIGFSVGFGYADRVAYKSLKSLFLLPFLGAIFAFMVLGSWRNAVAVAIRDRDLPDKGPQNRRRLLLLILAPWTAVAIVLWLAWSVLPNAGLVWGLGMLLCAHPSPFGRIERNPLFQSGAALILCTLIVMAFR